MASFPYLMMMLTLFVGTRQEGAKEKVFTMVREQFESYTIIEGQGYYQGRGEPVWEVKIATADPIAVLNLAGRIREELHQESVGIEHAGHYHRLTCDHPADELRQLIQAAC